MEALSFFDFPVSWFYGRVPPCPTPPTPHPGDLVQKEFTIDIGRNELGLEIINYYEDLSEFKQGLLSQFIIA